MLPRKRLGYIFLYHCSGMIVIQRFKNGTKNINECECQRIEWLGGTAYIGIHVTHHGNSWMTKNWIELNWMTWWDRTLRHWVCSLTIFPCTNSKTLRAHLVKTRDLPTHSFFGLYFGDFLLYFHLPVPLHGPETVVGGLGEVGPTDLLQQVQYNGERGPLVRVFLPTACPNTKKSYTR